MNQNWQLPKKVKIGKGFKQLEDTLTNQNEIIFIGVVLFIPHLLLEEYNSGIC